MTNETKKQIDREAARIAWEKAKAEEEARNQTQDRYCHEEF